MGMLEFFVRVFDNIEWINNANSDGDVIRAILNIFILFMGNFFNLFISPFLY